MTTNPPPSALPAVKNTKNSVLPKLAKEKKSSVEVASDDGPTGFEKDVVSLIRQMQKPLQPYRYGEFDPDFMRLFMNEPFLGGVSCGISKIITEKMPTAFIGVQANGKSHEVTMGFNPHFMRSLDEKIRQGVIKHELYHMIFQHIFTRAIGEVSYSVMWNWATDLAINSIIGAENLPKMVLCPGVRGIDPKTGKPVSNAYADFIVGAPHGMSSDWYFEELRKIQEELGDQDNSIAIGSGMGPMDDHDGWQDVPEEVQDQIKDKVRELIEKGVMRADKSNDWGSMPQEIQEIIRRMISREIDWRSVVRNFIGRCRTMQRNSSIRKINKKMPYIFPGVKRPLRATFAAFIDQSGSMSDEDIALMFGELEGLAQETTVDVYHFDTAIDEASHTVWKKGMPFPKAHRTRMGGTSFQCVADFCNDRKNKARWSGVIILTDGYAPGITGGIVGARTLWVVTETGTMDPIRSGDLAVQMKKEQVFKRF